MNTTPNTTNNFTTVAAKVVASSSYDAKTISIVVALCLLMAFGTVGNGFVCYFFGWKRRNKWTIPDRLFLYLGIVDLLSSIVNPAVYLYLELTRYSAWHFGIIACKVVLPFGPITTLLSAFIIQIITIDRYLVIVKPFGRQHGARHINIAVFVAAVVSIAFYTQYIISLELQGANKTCRVLDVTERQYAIITVTTILIQDVTFIAVICFTNKAIFSRLKVRQKTFNSESGTEVTNMQRRKLSRMLVVMSSLFLILILPRDLLQLSYIFSWMDNDGILYTTGLKQANTIVKILYTSNSCVNVFIYSKMHTHFKEALKGVCRPLQGRHFSFSTESTAPRTHKYTVNSSTREHSESKM